MKKILVSILIPNYNKSPFLSETLDSILAQTYSHWECVIVDDHSTDESWEILKEYAKKDDRFKIHKRPERLTKGGNVCRNYAFELSKGKFVNWFDSDDLMKSNFIERKVNLLENKDVDAVVSKMTMFSSDIQNPIYKEWIPPFFDLKEDYLLKNIQFTTPGPMFRRDFLIEKELFFESLKIGQDTEFFYRLVLKGLKVVVVDSVLAYCRVSDNSVLASFRTKRNTVDAHYQTFLMIKNLIKTKDIPPSLNNFIKIKMVYFFKLLLKEKKIIMIFDWVYVLILFFVYKRNERFSDN